MMINCIYNLHFKNLMQRWHACKKYSLDNISLANKKNKIIIIINTKSTYNFTFKSGSLQSLNSRIPWKKHDNPLKYEENTWFSKNVRTAQPTGYKYAAVRINWLSHKLLRSTNWNGWNKKWIRIFLSLSFILLFVANIRTQKYLTGPRYV